MKQTDPHFKIRLPADLKARIENASRSAGRSMNSEIVMRLQASFAHDEEAFRNEMRRQAVATKRERPNIQALPLGTEALQALQNAMGLVEEALRTAEENRAALDREKPE